MGRVLLCATGSVAGIKVPELAQHLRTLGLECRVVATQHGRNFLQHAPRGGTLPTGMDTVLDEGGEERPHSHIDLVDWADVLLIAPLSANTLAKVALGLCDNLVTRIARCWDVHKPLLLAPAMNTKMWQHGVTAQHLQAVRGFGARVVEPVSKKLACGDMGVGAMASVGSIADAVLAALDPEGRIATPSGLHSHDAVVRCV